MKVSGVAFSVMAFRKVSFLLFRSRCNHFRSYTYKSRYNLETLYPESVTSFTPLDSSSFTTSSDDKFVGEVPQGKLKFAYSRSSGPGGQHVNKTETKVEARFKVLDADWLPLNTRQAILEQYRKRITKNGELIVSCDQSRYRMQNTKNCLDQIKEIIDQVQKEPSRAKENEIAKLYNVASIQAAHKKRLKRKKMDSFTKNMRSDFD